MVVTTDRYKYKYGVKYALSAVCTIIQQQHFLTTKWKILSMVNQPALLLADGNL